MKKIFLICLAVVFALCIVPASAAAADTAAYTEGLTESETFDKVEQGASFSDNIKEALVIMATSSTEDEACNKLLALNPKGDVEEIRAIFSEFKEYETYVWDCRECIVYDFLYNFSDEMVVIEESWARWFADTYYAGLPADCEYEGTIEIDDTMSLSEVILAVADRCGISVEEAEKMVADIRVIGDRYLGENDLWVRISADMEEHPAKWTMLGLLLATVFVLIGVLIKRVINDAMTNQRMKVALENLDKALNGDEKDENGKALSIRAMIGEKNGQIEKLEKENEAQREEIGSLKRKAEELAGVITGLNNAISKIESNSDTSLKITEESALQLIQLINIALDRKVPITSKEARQIWYEHTQNNIKRIYEEGTDNGGATEEA